MARRAVTVVVTALAVVATWSGWMGWDRHRDVDPATGTVSGPYEPWQVVGCVLCLVVVAGLATRWSSTGTIVAVVPTVFTMAWSVSAATGEGTGANLWPIGAVMVFGGALVATMVVAVPTRLLWRRRASPAG